MDNCKHCLHHYAKQDVVYCCACNKEWVAEPAYVSVPSIWEDWNDTGTWNEKATYTIHYSRN